MKVRDFYVIVSLFNFILLTGTGETDWKVMAIDVNDPLASQLNSKPRKLFNTLKDSIFKCMFL
jgi:inorganic pyrophosphatase